MRAAYDFSPWYPTLIGADRLAAVAETARARIGAPDDRPYDIETTGDGGYRISLGVAGFRADELQVTVQANLLVIRGRKAERGTGTTYLYQGFALRPFEQHFELADYLVVTEARYANGLLTIDVERQMPDGRKPRRIAINTPGRAPPYARLARTRRPPIAA